MTTNKEKLRTDILSLKERLIADLECLSNLCSFCFQNKFYLRTVKEKKSFMDKLPRIIKKYIDMFSETNYETTFNKLETYKKKINDYFVELHIILGRSIISSTNLEKTGDTLINIFLLIKEKLKPSVKEMLNYELESELTNPLEKFIFTTYTTFEDSLKTGEIYQNSDNHQETLSNAEHKLNTEFIDILSTLFTLLEEKIGGCEYKFEIIPYPNIDNINYTENEFKSLKPLTIYKIDKSPVKLKLNILNIKIILNHVSEFNFALTDELFSLDVQGEQNPDGTYKGKHFKGTERYSENHTHARTFHESGEALVYDVKKWLLCESKSKTSGLYTHIKNHWRKAGRFFFFTDEITFNHNNLEFKNILKIDQLETEHLTWNYKVNNKNYYLNLKVKHKIIHITPVIDNEIDTWGK